MSKLLNHVERGITAVYDRHCYDAEKRAALDWWGVKLQALLEHHESSLLVLLAVAAVVGPPPAAAHE